MYSVKEIESEAQAVTRWTDGLFQWVTNLIRKWHLKQHRKLAEDSIVHGIFILYTGW